MRKEIFFAILAGSAFGLLIAYGVWRANSALKPKTTSQNSIITNNTTTQNKTVTQTTSTGLRIEKPESLIVLTDTPTEVSGFSAPNSWVTVSGEDNDVVVNSGESGNFNTNIDLEGGENQVLITAFDKDGNPTKTNLDLIFSSQFVKDASASGQAISYIGTVTDITNSIIQIKNASGDIQQINGGNASYIDTRGSTNKNIKITDTAIGDYLIAMGYKDGDNILNASRIIVADTATSTTRVAIFGTVTDDSGYNKFIFKAKNGDTITATPDTGITVAGAEKSFGAIKNDEKVIVVGEIKNGTINARTIQVIK